MLNFPCLILKVNSCLFSSFPFDNTQFHPQMGTLNTISGLFPWKGHSRIPVGCHIAWVMKWRCWCLLGTIGGQGLGVLCPSQQRTRLPWVACLAPPNGKLFSISSLTTIVCVCVLSHSDSLRPTDYSPPGSSVHGIFQVRTLEWVAISFSGESSQPKNCTCISYVDRQILYYLSHQGSPSQVKSVHNHCQQFHTRCSALALTLIPKDEARSYLPKEKCHIIFCTRSQK